MTITFLGTGTSQGIPVIACSCAVCTSGDTRDHRLRTSILISDRESNIVIDSGPDFRQQMLRENVKTLAAVVFTHEHKDHIAGLDDVRAFNYRSGNKMDVYCTAEVEKALRREFYYAFEASDYPGIPRLRVNLFDSEKFTIEEITLEPLEVRHMNLPVTAFRVKNFIYVTDANFISEVAKEKMKGADVLVLNALRKEKHPSHFNLEQAIQMVEQLQPRIAYFTHISHQLGCHQDIEEELPSNIRLAYDGLKLEL